MTDTMKAIAAQESGGPDVLQLTDVPTPEPGPDQVLVRTAATGVNFIETYQREGIYPVEHPFTPGSEGAGVVTAVGENVTSVSVGQRVATSEATRSYAEYFVVDAAKAMPVPDEMSDHDAAAPPSRGSPPTTWCVPHSSSSPSTPRSSPRPPVAWAVWRFSS